LKVFLIASTLRLVNGKRRMLVPTSVAVFGYLLAFGAGVRFVFQQAVNANMRV